MQGHWRLIHCDVRIKRKWVSEATAKIAIERVPIFSLPTVKKYRILLILATKHVKDYTTGKWKPMGDTKFFFQNVANQPLLLDRNRIREGCHMAIIHSKP